MIYALLLNKQQNSYNRAYTLLKDAALDLGLTLDPLSLMCDMAQGPIPWSCRRIQV